ncbi:MAG TPA: lysophospholipid acyltransferase family protein [Candidatus Saccharimonadales bacterium]|nr:lysophospholipid acyltransferase family protein [Candidatus Saccharimonadales bacterium]
MKSNLAYAPVPRPGLYDAAIHSVVAATLRTFGPLHTTGSDVLAQQEGGFILAPAHRSQLDILAIGAMAHHAIGAQVHFLGKQELWTKPYMVGTRRVFSALGAIPVDRSKPLPNETRVRIGSILERAGVICIYPEGHRMRGDTFPPKSLKDTVAVLAASYQAPIVPVGITGTEKGNRAPIAVAVGEPIDVASLAPEASQNFRQAVRARKLIMPLLYERLQAAQDEAVRLRQKLL